MNRFKQAWIYLLVFVGSNLYGTTDELMNKLTTSNAQSANGISGNIINGGKTLATGAFSIMVYISIAAGFALATIGAFKLAKSKQENQGEGVEGAMKAIGGGIFLIIISYVIGSITK